MPLLAILAGATFVLLIGTWWKKINSEALFMLAIVSLVAAIYFSWQNWLGSVFLPAAPWLAAFELDNKLALLGIILFAISSGIAIISAHNYVRERGQPMPEFLALVLFAVFGAGVMAVGTNLIVIFIGLETLSLSAYVLAGFNKGDASSHEAAIKYFILGAVASAVFLFGIAFYYGATGSVAILNPSHHVSNMKMLYMAIGLLFAGLSFKIAAVPFQWWTPDVYQGAPLPVTTFFATTVKAAAFIMFFRIFDALYHIPDVNLAGLISVVAVATMSFGNLAALFQEDIKRMLAYSSIAHAGYMLLAFVFLREDSASAGQAMIFYLAAYIVMTTGAFSVLAALAGPSLVERTHISNVAPLSRASPWLALVFTVFLLSLAGFPPTAGFMAKFYLFRATVQNGHTTLVIIAVINSLISVYYYMRPVVAMYFGEQSFANSTYEVKSVNTSYSIVGVIIFSAISVILLGLLPSSVLMIIGR